MWLINILMTQFKYEMLGRPEDHMIEAGAQRLNNLDLWANVIDVINHVDKDKVLVHIPYFFTPWVLKDNIKVVIKSLNYEETPSLHSLVEWCNLNPNVKFFCLGDIDVYDFPYPENLQFIDYRFFYIELAQLLELYRPLLKPVKQKNIKYKFSSLTHRRRQFRAVVTAKLLQVAKEQSLISWHNETNDSTGVHDAMIESLKNIDKFQEFDWTFLDKIIQPDTWDKSLHSVPKFILNPDYPAYSDSLINFTNETFWLGLYQTDKARYMRPGPLISEKTWKCLGTGTMFINCGQPFMYNFLKEKYHLDLDFDVDLSFDTIEGDIDRMIAVCDTIDHLNSFTLDHLIDANIDACEQMQNTVLDQGYIESFRNYNKRQDEKLLNLIHLHI